MVKTGSKYVVSLLAVVVTVLAPGASAVTGKPLPGRLYAYAKILPKSPGWHSPSAPRNVVVVRVGGNGTSLDVGWGLWSGSGCSSRSPSGASSTWLASVFMRTTLRSLSFHVIDARPHVNGWRYDRREAYGHFSPAGGYFDVRLRQKAYGVAPSGDIVRCDGRWLTFRARLQPPGTRLTPW